MDKFKSIAGTEFYYSDSLQIRLMNLHNRILHMWDSGSLNSRMLKQIYQQSKIDELFHSNRIEGNSLTFGESRAVIEEGVAISGKPTKDQIEARNLSSALDFVQEFALQLDKPLTQHVVRQIHSLILHNIQEDAGSYRMTTVEIAGSKHALMDPLLVPQAMMAFSDFIVAESPSDLPPAELPILFAVAAHTLLVHIHPFTDGNGRTARALLNLILMRNRYLPCIITEDDRHRYIDAVQFSQDSNDLTPLIELVLENVALSLESFDWLLSVSARLEQTETESLQEEYAVWHNAMDYLKVQFKHTVDNFNAVQTTNSAFWKFADYGSLDISKYMSLHNRKSRKKTWFFGVELNSSLIRSRYVFFFAPADRSIRGRNRVVLSVAKNTASGYQTLEHLSNQEIPVPDTIQIGFDISSRTFVAIGKGGMRERNPVNLVQQFLNQVIERDFAT